MQISISNAIGGGGGTQGGGTPTPPPFSNTESILLDGIDAYVDCGNAFTSLTSFSVFIFTLLLLRYYFITILFCFLCCIVFFCIKP